MAQLFSERRDIDFVLYEQLDTEALTRKTPFDAFDRKTFDLIINEARTFATKALHPVNEDGDRIGVNLKDGQVRVPESFHRAFGLLLEGDWMSLSEPTEVGGQGLPAVIATAVYEYFYGANYCLVNYGNMGHGTGKMVDLFGTDAQKDLFLKKMAWWNC